MKAIVEVDLRMNLYVDSDLRRQQRSERSVKVIPPDVGVVDIAEACVV